MPVEVARRPFRCYIADKYGDSNDDDDGNDGDNDDDVDDVENYN